MSDYWSRMYEPAPAFKPEERPDFYELQQNAEAGIVKRGLTRYFFTRNYERSIKMHRMLGTPLIRKAVMGTIGRVVSRPGMGGNYRLDNSKSRIEAATKFAVNGSIFNEAIHTVAATPTSVEVATSIAEGRYGTGFIANAAGAGFNLALVALQRYNRARMIKRVDEELAGGATFRPGYENWLGIDARAVENYREGLEQSAIEPASVPQHRIASPAIPQPDTL